MVKNTSISLGPHFGRFIERQIDDGRFGSASEVVRAGLRLLEEQETRLRALQQALEDGERSGKAEDFNIEHFLQVKRETASR